MSGDEKVKKAENGMTVRYIARIYTDFEEKFGLPRQSGLVPELKGRIVFEPKFRNPEALREIEGFSHLWLLFDFSLAHREGWTATVRPPRLGGNRRVGVFASRSPFRPNPVGLSCVKLEKVELTGKDGPVLTVSGIDTVSGTPIIDIKPYLPLSDCRPEARGGYSDEAAGYELGVEYAPGVRDNIPEHMRAAVEACIKNDPRPSYQDEPERVYGMNFDGIDVKFTVLGGKALITGADAASDGRFKEAEDDECP